MSEQQQGIVTKVFTKDGRKSLRLDGVDAWFNCNYDLPDKVQEGMEVMFTWNADATGRYRNVDCSTIKARGEGKAPPKKAWGGKKNSYQAKAAEKDAYWKDKEVRDIGNGRTISYQAATNTAINIVNSALEQGFLAKPGGKAADKFDLYKAMIAETAEELFAIYQRVPDNYDNMMGGVKSNEEGDATTNFDELPDFTSKEGDGDDWE